MGTFLVACGVLFSLGVIGVDNVDNSIYKAKSKNNAELKNKITYWDGKGREYHVKTGKRCFYRSIKNGYAFVDEKYRLLSAHYRNGKEIECTIRYMDIYEWEKNVYTKFLFDKQK